MDRDAILAKVIEVVDDTLSLGDDVTLDENTNLKEIGADSFDLLELVTALEDEFSMTFPDEAVGWTPSRLPSSGGSFVEDAPAGGRGRAGLRPPF